MRLIGIFRGKGLGITFCILLAALAWLIGNLSQKNTQQYRVKILYKDLPSEKFITPQSTSYLNVELEGIGFSLFKYAFSHHTIILSFNELKKVKKSKYILDNALISQINKQNYPDVSLSIIEPDTLTIEFQKTKQKKIPVKIQFDIPLVEDYRIDSYQIFPDSVIVAGLENDLDTITGLYLRKKENKTVMRSFAGEIPINNTNKIHYNISKIDYSVQVKRVTEVRTKTKVQLLHAPLSAEVKLFPEEVTILVSGNIEEISQLKSTDITVIADYNKKKNGVMPLSIHKKPSSLKVTLPEENQVEYLVEH